MKKSLQTIVILILFCGKIFSQEPYYTKFTSDDGLVALANFNVVQDKDNLIWVGTKQGLFYYNGRKFIEVKNSISTTKSIFNLQIDNEGQIWCSTISGQIYRIVNKEFHLFKDFSKKLKGAFPHLIVMRNCVFFLSQKESYKINIKTGEVNKIDGQITKIVKSNNSFFYYNLSENNIITQIYQDEEEVVTRKIKCYGKFLLDKGKFQMFKWFDEIVIIPDKMTIKPFSIDINTRKLNRIKLPSSFKKLQVYNSKNYQDNWLLTSNGIYRSIEKRAISDAEHIFKGFHITDVLKDNENNFWLTTLQNGVFVVPNLGIRKKNFFDIKDDIISVETLPENHLLLGTQNGKLIDFNTQSNSYTQIDLLNQRPINRIRYDNVLGRAYVSTNGTNSYIYDVKSKRIREVGEQFATAKGLAQISKDSLIYLSYRHALVYTNLTKNKDHIVLENKRPISTFYDSINKLIYITYIDGAVVYDKNLNKVPVKYRNKPIILYKYTQTNNGKIWATSGDKILELKAEKVIDSLTYSKGLLRSPLKGLMSRECFLWIVTAKGIQRYNTNEKSIKTLNLTDKNTIKFKHPEIQNGYLWIPGNSFLCKIDLSILDSKQSKKVPLAYISNVKIGGKEEKLKTEYELPYKTNDITFNLNFNGFLASSKNVLEYKLLGFNTEWQTSELNDNIVRYIGIPSGNYEFLYRAKSLDGSIGKQSKGVKIIIHKPFWENWWFIVTVFIVSFFMIVIYYRIKLRLREKEVERELEKVILASRISKLKLENLRSQMNPHFIFNSLGAIQDYVMNNEKYLASDYLVKFSRLIRMYLNHSRINVISLKEELKSLEMYIALEQLRFENKFNVQFLIDKSINQNKVKIPPLFLQPFVENAIKHGLIHRKEEGNLLISITEDSAGIMIVTIDDDGIGRIKSSKINMKRQNHKSFAVNATKERVLLYKKEKLFNISIDFIDKVGENNEAIGTTVILKIKRI
ncbi:YXYXY domain-containing protein [Tenacibaculum sp. 190130A14a]|uniref:YXYXY domain-containing protein n=1 Tax=Tenacibaculum polynesiense TaxID=3137857 RepID=A0ABP1F1V2_9FLAO